MIGNDSREAATKYVIVHGHFYQPPRENPWLDTIETQASAAPHSDWNERIYDQCYRPNAYSRLLDSKGMITGIHNNYQNMSFNFGPTLFSWLEQRHVTTAGRIIDADEESRTRLDGCGNAIAQVYNHMIMPLASRRDQLTQIRWSKHFFRKRFGRDPQGMWLAETAINMETVQCLIEEKLRFVILAPSQAEEFRPLHDQAPWVATAQQGIDTRRAYRVFAKNQAGKRLPGFLDVFFFDEGLSKEISFGGLLNDAHVLGSRIESCFNKHQKSNQAVVIATDGETFGHHKPFGDMCLAYFFRHTVRKLGIVPVNFGYFLLKSPPEYEVRLKNAFGEGTAWSCAHGVGRWIRDCGCKTGGQDSWNQAWRQPLRLALDDLQEAVDEEFERIAGSLQTDAWQLRDRYIAMIDNPSQSRIKRLLEKNSGAPVSGAQVRQMRRLLEAQKFMLFSYTSCGWFFSDVSGIETVQNLAYACRALQLGIPAVRQAAVLEALLAKLDTAVSNLPNTTGRTLFERHMLPFFEHEKILAYTAAIKKYIGVDRALSSSLFRYRTRISETLTKGSGNVDYRGYDVELTNDMTGECSTWSVLIVNRLSSEISGWVVSPGSFSAVNTGPRPEDWMKHKDARMFTMADLFQTSRAMFAKYFLHRILRDTDTRFAAWMRRNSKELEILSRLTKALPDYCAAPLGLVLNEQWNRAMSRLEQGGEENGVLEELLELSRTMKQFTITINYAESAGTIDRLLTLGLAHLRESPDSVSCDRIRYLLTIVDRFSLPVSKNKLEDLFFPVLTDHMRKLFDEVSAISLTEKGGTVAGDVYGQKKELLINLISFARRMNFNTDAFQITSK